MSDDHAHRFKFDCTWHVQMQVDAYIYTHLRNFSIDPKSININYEAFRSPKPLPSVFAEQGDDARENVPRIRTWTFEKIADKINRKYLSILINIYTW